MKNFDTQIYVPIMKVDEEKRMVYGYCTSESKDSQGEIVEKAAIREAWDDYMKFANVREMHQPSAVGKVKEAQHDDFGTYIGAKVVDDIAWKKVLEKVYMGFSIGGKVLEKIQNRIKKLRLSEISLVDRPANPDAIFVMVKMDDAGNLVNGEGVESPQLTNKGTENMEIKKEETPGQSPAPEKTEEEKAAEAKAKEEQEAKDKAEADAKAKADQEAKEKADADAKAQADAAAAAGAQAGAPAQASAPADADAGKGEKTITLRKDVDGVIALAQVVDHLDFIMDCFNEAGKAATAAKLKEALAAAMAAVEMESTDASDAETIEQAVKNGDLKKMFTGVTALVKAEMSKLSETVVAKQEDLAKQFASFEERLVKVENAPASPRPVAPMTVEKGFVPGAAAEGDTLEKAQKEYSEIVEKVDQLNKQVKENPESEAKKAELEELGKQYFVARRKVIQLGGKV